MAKLTMLTNQLNEIQLKNLKLFPFVFFEGINELMMDYDLSNNIDVSTEEDKEKVDIEYKVETKTDNLRVSYHLTLEPAIQQTHMPKRFEALEGSVRGLLWKDIKVQVFLNGIKAFESKKNE